MALNITSSNFEELVLKSEKPVLLDFWASWCGPCMMLSPVVDEVASENPGIVVGKVNVDEDIALANAFGISSIPALFVVKNGKVTSQTVGVVPKEKILRMLEE